MVPCQLIGFHLGLVVQGFLPESQYAFLGGSGPFFLPLRPRKSRSLFLLLSFSPESFLLPEHLQLQLSRSLSVLAPQSASPVLGFSLNGLA